MTEAELSILSTFEWVSMTVYCCTFILLHWAVAKDWGIRAVVAIGSLCMISVIATVVSVFVVDAYKPDYKSMVGAMQAQGCTLSLDHVEVEGGD